MGVLAARAARCPSLAYKVCHLICPFACTNAATRPNRIITERYTLIRVVGLAVRLRMPIITFQDKRGTSMWDWMPSISGTNLAIICATLLGPVLAVQAQKWLEGNRAIKERRLAIFRTLMATRAANLSPQHVEALNAVPVEFYGTSKKLKQINEAWKLYLDHHDERLAPNDAWAQKRRDLFLELLHPMSQFLGYEFTKAQIDRDIYSPKAHGDLELDQTIIRRGIVALLKGEIALPMAVKEFPATEPTPEVQAAILKLLTNVQQPKPLAIEVDKEE